jgi:hypothetical protein
MRHVPCLQCCLPAGIDVVLQQNLGKADLSPHTYACVLTGEHTCLAHRRTLSCAAYACSLISAARQRLQAV